MALKFLDEAGLSYFWSKLKALLAGKVSKTGDTMTGKLVVPSIRAANTYYGLTFGRTTATPAETILYTGIKWVSSAHMPVIHVTGYAYGLQSPVEFKIGFYIYGGNIGWSGVTNMGSWSPDVYLFKYTNDGVDYVAVGFAGKCYFLQLQADLQDEMGKFNNVVLNSGAWSWSFLTTAGTIPTPDSGATCIKVPYKADILNPSKVNNHTVASDVPANAVFTDTVTTATTSGSGNAVTAISASNGALTVTKGTTFLTQHQDISGKANTTAVVASASISNTGLISYKNSGDTTLFTLQLPVCLIPRGASSTGNTVSVANNTNTTIASILLEKGVYILIGVGRFASNTSGYRRLYFAFDEEGNAADRYCMTNVAPVSGAVTIPQVVWLQTITADDTYVYLRALQTSGTSLNVTYAGIQVIRISDYNIT